MRVLITGSRDWGDEVQDIRSRCRLETERALAIEFGVSRATIGRILRGESWKDPRTELQRAVEKWLEHEPAGARRSVVELLWRTDEKGNAIEDLKRAAGYCQREIERREAAR